MKDLEIPATLDRDFLIDFAADFCLTRSATRLDSSSRWGRCMLSTERMLCSPRLRRILVADKAFDAEARMVAPLEQAGKIAAPTPGW
jgi:hypothetical protein